jgi:hypothetical protein
MKSESASGRYKYKNDVWADREAKRGTVAEAGTLQLKQKADRNPQ